MVIGFDIGTVRCGVAILRSNGSIEGYVCSWEVLRDRLEAMVGEGEGEMWAVVEVPQPYGMSPLSVFQMALLCGIIIEKWRNRYGDNICLIPRPVVRAYACGSVRAKDKDVKAWVVDCMRAKWGVDEREVQRRLNKVGVRADAWQALGLALVFQQFRDELLSHASVVSWTKMIK
ncbi:MAG: hypothetical protein QXI60_03055 [Thermofilaceae archaeon]